MASLRDCLEKEGFTDVSTYIASGNVILKSPKSSASIKTKIEKALPSYFNLDSELIKVLVLTYSQLKSVIDEKPTGFGEAPKKYHSDVIFLIDIGVSQAISVFNPKDGVDKIWPGKNVVYSQRLSELRTKSRLSKIMGTPEYKSMTIRSWSTTKKLFELISKY